MYALNALLDSGYQPDRTTDIIVAHLASQQAANGRWFISAVARPPIGEGPIAVTAYAIRSLKAYAPPGRAAEINERIARATAWLAAETPATTEDRNMKLLGLLWAGRSAAERASLVKQIFAKQRADGGWAQTDHLQSDAYATGVSLFALVEAGGITFEHQAYKKGSAYSALEPAARRVVVCEEPRGEVSAVSRRRIPVRARPVDLGDGDRMGDGRTRACAAVRWQP